MTRVRRLSGDAGPDSARCRLRVLTWNGRDVPGDLPAGRYVVEPVDEDGPALSPEEAGLEAALESCCQGRVVDSKPTREIIDAALGR